MWVRRFLDSNVLFAKWLYNYGEWRLHHMHKMESRTLTCDYMPRQREWKVKIYMHVCVCLIIWHIQTMHALWPLNRPDPLSLNASVFLCLLPLFLSPLCQRGNFCSSLRATETLLAMETLNLEPTSQHSKCTARKLRLRPFNMTQHFIILITPRDTQRSVLFLFAWRG